MFLKTNHRQSFLLSLKSVTKQNNSSQFKEGRGSESEKKIYFFKKRLDKGKQSVILVIVSIVQIMRFENAVSHRQ